MGINGGNAEKRARAADRDLAVNFIEEAWVDGQLSREEYDERVGRVLVAATLLEVEHEVKDLQGPGGVVWAPTVPEVRPTPAPVLAPMRAPVTQGVADGRRWTGFAVGAVVAIAALIFAGNAMSQDEQVASVSEDYAEGFMVDPEYLADLVEDEFGTTEVFSVKAVDDEVTVVVPRDGTSQQAYESTWFVHQGGWSERKETSSKRERLNLTEVEVDAAGVGMDAWTSLVRVDEVVTRVRLGSYEGLPTCLTTTAAGGGEEFTLHYDCDGQVLN